MSYSMISRRLRCDISQIISSSSRSLINPSLPYTIPFTFAQDRVGTSASSYTFNAGVITLPAGYWYLALGSLNLSYLGGHCYYIFRDGSNNDLGRRGYMSTHKTQKAFGGDELAVALIDARNNSLDLKLVIQTFTNSGSCYLNSSSNKSYVGTSRIELWRFL